MRAHALHDSLGHIEFVRGGDQDITERKAAEERIREQDAELRQILKTSRSTCCDHTDQVVNVSISTASHLITSGLLLKSGSRPRFNLHSFIPMIGTGNAPISPVLGLTALLTSWN